MQRFHWANDRHTGQTQVGLLAFRLTGGLSTHITDRVLAGHRVARNDGACLRGDKEPLSPGDLGFCGGC